MATAGEYPRWVGVTASGGRVEVMVRSEVEEDGLAVIMDLMGPGARWTFEWMPASNGPAQSSEATASSSEAGGTSGSTG